LKVLIADINIGTRFRKDLGDIRSLVDSIKRHGLLHPVVITEQNDLICGRRRIAACEKLGMLHIEANIMSLPQAQEAEADENIVRKPFTVEEIAQIDQFYRDKEESAAEQRQMAGTSLPSGNFPKGRAREKIAARVGVSDRTLEKIRVIREASLQNPTTFGELWDKVGEGKMKIDKGYNQIKKFQRIKEAEKLASSSLQSNSKFSLVLGPMQEKGSEIVDNSFHLILTDPPYNEDSIPLKIDSEL
jgi:ParB family chromosome partitioning protein